LDELTIRGAGVVLRTPRPSDIDDIAAACADPLIQRYIPVIPMPYTRRDAAVFVQQARAGATDRMSYLVADPHTDRVLGMAGLHHLRWEEGTGEVGYWVAPWARGRGVATAATTALTRWAIDRGLARIELLTHPANWRSQRVAMDAGYRREGLRRSAGMDRDGGRYDLLAWARLAGDPPGPVPRTLPALPRDGLCDGLVTLRPLDLSDAPDLHALRSLPEVVAASVPPEPPKPGETQRRCAEAMAGWLAGARADLAIRETASDAFVGDIGLYYQEPITGQAMIGYSMLPDWRGRGYASRAVALLAGWAFEHAGIARLIAGTAPDNAGSQAVLTRVGFRREGYQRARLPGVAGTRIDDLLYALLPAELISPTRTPPQ
jgi:RimJ/RimL family protein N-acetyltransferase